MRNDRAGYVAASADGLHFDEPRIWCWDDGTELGNYNTQQHWVAHSDALYLVYTRTGANNDHVFRHRAPARAAMMRRFFRVEPGDEERRTMAKDMIVVRASARIDEIERVAVAPPSAAGCCSCRVRCRRPSTRCAAHRSAGRRRLRRRTRRGRCAS